MKTTGFDDVAELVRVALELTEPQAQCRACADALRQLAGKFDASAEMLADPRSLERMPASWFVSGASLLARMAEVAAVLATTAAEALQGCHQDHGD